MTDSERFSSLPEHAFARLRGLLDAHPPGGAPVTLTIGEPRHEMPGFLGKLLAAGLEGFGRYPPNEGSPGLLSAISGWIARRHGADVPPGRLMALNGSREGLFNACLALCPVQKGGQRPVVLMPNPFYHVYAAAALAAGAEPVFVRAAGETGFLPDYAALPAALLDRTAVAYVGSPSNPQGAIAPREWLADLLALAEKHDFRVFSDECYSELWREAPPAGLLDVGRDADPERIVVFNSLSKRSNLPGLRSGFVAAGPGAIARIRNLRAYGGAPLPLPLQAVAEAAWGDEAHVEASRRRYQEKYRMAGEIFDGAPGFRLPDGGMFLWLGVRDGEEAALRLWREAGLRVLPGAYLAREVAGRNPGRARIRVALVAPEEELGRALTLLRDRLYR